MVHVLPVAVVIVKLLYEAEGSVLLRIIIYCSSMGLYY